MHTFIGGPPTETKNRHAKMNISRATEYRNTSQLFIGVNLLKNCGCGVWGPRKKFSMLSFEMLNFYVFSTLEQGDSTAIVIKIFMTSAHQCRKYIGQCYLSFAIASLCCQMSPLLRYPVTDCYHHCSMFTVHNFTKTL